MVKMDSLCIYTCVCACVCVCACECVCLIDFSFHYATVLPRLVAMSMIAYAL